MVRSNFHSWLQAVTTHDPNLLPPEHVGWMHRQIDAITSVKSFTISGNWAFSNLPTHDYNDTSAKLLSATFNACQSVAPYPRIWLTATLLPGFFG